MIQTILRQEINGLFTPTVPNFHRWSHYNTQHSFGHLKLSNLLFGFYKSTWCHIPATGDDVTSTWKLICQQNYLKKKMVQPIKAGHVGADMALIRTFHFFSLFHQHRHFLTIFFSTIYAKKLSRKTVLLMSKLGSFIPA